MARIVLVTGGSRSGKSGYAQRLAESMPGRRLYIATCPVMDDEMARRVERHRQERAGRNWDTLEQQLRIGEAIYDASKYDCILVDCLTLWINNLMYEFEQVNKIMNEDDAAISATQLLADARTHPGTVVFVTNEVGWGIVPENALARRFRDLAGRCNQIIAAGADEVVLLCCGMPMKLKGN